MNNTNEICGAMYAVEEKLHNLTCVYGRNTPLGNETNTILDVFRNRRLALERIQVSKKREISGSIWRKILNEIKNLRDNTSYIK
jgi:hypothetical protein